MFLYLFYNRGSFRSYQIKLGSYDFLTAEMSVIEIFRFIAAYLQVRMCIALWARMASCGVRRQEFKSTLLLPGAMLAKIA